MVAHYSTRDTETTRLGSWANWRYAERSNEQAKYRSSPPVHPSPQPSHTTMARWLTPLLTELVAGSAPPSYSPTGPVFTPPHWGGLDLSSSNGADKSTRGGPRAAHSSTGEGSAWADAPQSQAGYGVRRQMVGPGCSGLGGMGGWR